MLRLEFVRWELGSQELEILGTKMSGGGVVKQPKIPPDFRPVADGHFESLIEEKLGLRKNFLGLAEFFVDTTFETAKNAY